jgi:hypothetical protein
MRDSWLLKSGARIAAVGAATVASAEDDVELTFGGEPSTSGEDDVGGDAAAEVALAAATSGSKCR